MVGTIVERLAEVIGDPFQSLRGLGVGWNLAIAHALLSIAKFQSLRGLGVGWNLR